MNKLCKCCYCSNDNYCRYFNVIVTVKLSKQCKYKTLYRLKKKIRLTKKS
ncbi:MAG: hypothetical protein J6D47_03625 [Peptostreptococcaceae bacterium]|nr:hypothetical protein [Peptostreptococcaceae bacterium]